MPVIDKIAKRYELFMPDVKEFLEALESRPRPSFRVNTIKAPEDILGRLGERIDGRVEWFGDGYFSTEPLGKTIEHFLGYIYIQEASSMLPPAVLNPGAGEKVLDMAAAPGSKTTQMAAMMGNKGTIVANDISSGRIKALVENLSRMGVTNTAITRMDGRSFGKKYPEYFDKVLLDAPCSGEGLIRKLKELDWSMKKVLSLSNLQKQLILSAYKALKPGGLMAYSTCTGSPEENEGVVSYLVEKTEAKIVRPDVKGKFRQGVVEFGRFSYNPEVRKCIRIYPQDTGTEMFFLCLIRKPL